MQVWENKFKATSQVTDWYSVFERAAPTLQAALRRAYEENAALKVKVKSLEEKVTLLEDDKQFLRQSLNEALVISKAVSGRSTQAHISGSDSSEDEDSSFVMPEDTISRYRRVLKAVSRGMSKTDAYSYVGVNRKTIINTAAIAELKEVDPESSSQIQDVFHKGRKGHTLYDFTEQCRAVFSKKPKLKTTVEQMKEDGRRLDIHTRD
ncbi:hypothetical protein SRHO_G00052610 [Serrasalmus rhombeus]